MELDEIHEVDSCPNCGSDQLKLTGQGKIKLEISDTTLMAAKFDNQDSFKIDCLGCKSELKITKDGVRVKGNQA